MLNKWQILLLEYYVNLSGAEYLFGNLMNLYRRLVLPLYHRRRGRHHAMLARSDYSLGANNIQLKPASQLGHRRISGVRGLRF